MSEYFIYGTSKKFTKAAANRIRKAIKAIDDSADFDGPLTIPGQQTTGMLYRPNDGRNDDPEFRQRNRRMEEIARKEIEGDE